MDEAVMPYEEQRRILLRAYQAGWRGEWPGVLGGYYAEKVVKAAQAYLEEQDDDQTR